MKFFSKLFGQKKRPLDKPKPGRNDECWCGSGMKYKKCHLEADAEVTSRQLASGVMKRG